MGHNVYILAYQLARHSSEVANALKQYANDDAICYYKDHTAQVEVRGGRVRVGMMRMRVMGGREGEGGASYVQSCEVFSLL